MTPNSGNPPETPTQPTLSGLRLDDWMIASCTRAGPRAGARATRRSENSTWGVYIPPSRRHIGLDRRRAFALTISNLWRANVTSHVNENEAGTLARQFLTRTGLPVVTQKFVLVVRELGLLDVGAYAAELIGGSLSGVADTSCVAVAPSSMVHVYLRHACGRPATYSEYEVHVVAERGRGERIAADMRSKFGTHRVAKVRWWYRNGPGAQTRSTFIEPLETRLRPEFYPALGGEEPSAYLRRYVDSEAPVILIAGEPGTGKTTLLRHLVTDFNLTADVVYDEELMEEDSVFQDFLFGEPDVMIIEDADTILLPRADGKNKLMARFLNMSDGLIKIPRKKLVFTTNLSDFSRIDAALVRPGRCFDILRTRPLAHDEALAAAAAADLSTVSWKRSKYTLAEIFAGKKAPAPRAAGFVTT